MDSCEYEFYDSVIKTNKYLFGASILFVIMIYRTVKYFYIIWNAVNKPKCSFLDMINIMFSFVPFMLSAFSFIVMIYVVFNVYDSHYFSKGTRYSTPCSLKTLKIINRFSELETRGDDFYYIDKNGEATCLRFSFPVFVYVCYYVHFRTNAKYINEKHKRDKKKETELYKTLISDIEEIKKENEKEAERCMKRQKKI